MPAARTWSSSISTGVPARDAPVTTVPPDTVVSVPVEVAVRSVTIDLIWMSPRMFRLLISERACTLTEDPSVVVSA